MKDYRGAKCVRCVSLPREVVVLHHTLAAGGCEELAPRFFDHVTKVVDITWAVAVGADFGFEGPSAQNPAAPTPLTGICLD